MMFRRPFDKHISKYYPFLKSVKMIRLFEGVKKDNLDDPNSLEELTKHLLFEFVIGNEDVIPYVKSIVGYLKEYENELNCNLKTYYDSLSKLLDEYSEHQNI